MKKLSRRSMLKISGAAAAGVLLSATGCAPAAPQTAIEQSPLPTAAEKPTLAPAAAQAAICHQPTAQAHRKTHPRPPAGR